MRSQILALAVLAFAASGAANAQPSEAPKGSCFFVNQFESWRPLDNKTIIIRVNLDKYYRLGLSYDCPELKWPQAHLIMNVRGPNTICQPLDWDLKVSTNPDGITTPCIVKTMTQLTPEEAAALPKGSKP